MTKLVLPKIGYGPICLRILEEFIEYHKLPEILPLPEAKEATHMAMIKIFDIILYSMGEEKRQELIKEALDYYHDLPIAVR